MVGEGDGAHAVEGCLGNDFVGGEGSIRVTGVQVEVCSSGRGGPHPTASSLSPCQRPTRCLLSDTIVTDRVLELYETRPPAVNGDSPLGMVYAISPHNSP
jgi:hypothetical protein